MKKFVVAGRGLSFLGLCLLSSCYVTQNSVSGDPYTYQAPSAESNDPATLRLKAFQSVLLRNCLSCHGGSAVSGGGLSFTQGLSTSDDWKKSDLIVVGHPENSDLMLALQQNGGSMPDGHDPISAADYQALSDFITNL